MGARRKSSQLSEDTNWNEIKEESSNQSSPGRNSSNLPHRFVPTIFKIIKRCHHCKSLIMGLRRHDTLHCEVCKINVHKRCKNNIVDNCGEETKKMSKSSPNVYIAFISDSSDSKISTILESLTTSESVSDKYFERDAIDKMPFSNESEELTKIETKVDDKSQPKLLKEWPKNRYTFIKVLHRGNFGKVVLVKKNNNHNNKEINVLKIVKKDMIIGDSCALDSVMVERNIFFSLEKHPFIVYLHRFFQSKEHFFFVMEYLSGGNLMYHLKKQRTFNKHRACFYAAEVALALRFLHRHGIIYRNLKLEHIILDAEGHCKLIDFDVSKHRILNTKRTNSICGTPKSMAPELLQQIGYGPSVDWWALGVVLYEMLVGKAPFNADNNIDLYKKIANDDVIYPRRLTKAAVSILQGLMTKNPNHRLGCVFRDDMEEAILNHKFFKHIDWVALEQRKMQPPFKPKIKSETDAKNFDAKFTKEPLILTPVDKAIVDSNLEEVAGFTFLN